MKSTPSDGGLLGYLSDETNTLKLYFKELVDLSTFEKSNVVNSSKVEARLARLLNWVGCMQPYLTGDLSSPSGPRPAGPQFPVRAFGSDATAPFPLPGRRSARGPTPARIASWLLRVLRCFALYWCKTKPFDLLKFKTSVECFPLCRRQVNRLSHPIG
jgi:hypothetical protein